MGIIEFRYTGLFVKEARSLGFRYRMDVVPLEPKLVRGSHGLENDPDDGAMILGPDAPTDMLEFSAYVRDLAMTQAN